MRIKSKSSTVLVKQFKLATYCLRTNKKKDNYLFDKQIHYLRQIYHLEFSIKAKALQRVDVPKFQSIGEMHNSKLNGIYLPIKKK